MRYKMDLADIVANTFREKFHRAPLIVMAPGRINLIGEHIDYNEGFVLPAAIDRYLVFAIAPNDSNQCHVFAQDLNEGSSFAVDDLHRGFSWMNYLMGVMDGLRQRGLKTGGIDCVFASDIPAGAGLSSSAALCSGFGFALNQLFNLGADRLELARIAQYAEHEFAGLLCGIMDMYASLFGKKDAALLLDCRSLTHELLPVQLKGYSLLLIDSKVKHMLASSAYNERRACCEVGVSIIGKQHAEVQSLRDVPRALLQQYRDKMSKEVFSKCSFVVEEIERTQRAAQLLKANDLKGFGQLMYDTHDGLSRIYDVSCAELDFLVALAAEEKDHVLGARMMGGGFGGCTLNLVANEWKDAFCKKVGAKYFATFKKEPDFYPVNLSEGVHQLKK
jgi:galactokinase